MVTDKGLCPKCKQNRRVLVSPPNVGRSERVRYGPACAACMTDMGFVRYELNGLIWWEKQIKDDEDISDEELFNSLNSTNIWADRVPS